jgi:hypothetical protein
MVKTYYENPALAQSCAANGVLSVQKNNDPTTIALQTISYYQRIIREQL